MGPRYVCVWLNIIRLVNVDASLPQVERCTLAIGDAFRPSIDVSLEVALVRANVSISSPDKVMCFLSLFERRTILSILWNSDSPLSRLLEHSRTTVLNRRDR